MKLLLPELLGPASTVRGLIERSILWAIDLNPRTLIPEIDGGGFFAFRSLSVALAIIVHRNESELVRRHRIVRADGHQTSGFKQTDTELQLRQIPCIGAEGDALQFTHALNPLLVWRVHYSLNN